MNSFTSAFLGDVLEFKRGYDLPQRLRSRGTVPVVSSSGITDYHSIPMVRGPGVVTGRYGTLGQVFYLQEDFWPLNTALYVRDFKGNDPHFIAYFLRSLDFYAYSDKAAVPGLNRNDLYLAPITYPADVKDQRVIASYLAMLDDKIDLNRRMNATLEEIARAYFKDWFVDFGPTYAKMEGRAPYLAPDVWALFPDQLDDEGKPDGWTVASLGRYITVERGLSYKGDYLSSNGNPMINLACFKGEGFFEHGSLKYYNGPFRSKHRATPGTLVMANTDLTQHRTVLGSPYVVGDGVGDDAIFSHHVYALRPRSPDVVGLTSFFYHHLLHPEFRQRAQGFATGTTVLFLPSDAIEDFEIAMPCRNLIGAFNDLITPLHKEQEANRAQSRTLAAIRDLLLPKLMSGQIPICDAAAMVADAA